MAKCRDGKGRFISRSEYASVGNREELADLIYQLHPINTPFDSTKKTKVADTLHTSKTYALKPRAGDLEIKHKLEELHARALWTGAGALFFWLLFLFIIHRAVVAV